MRPTHTLENLVYNVRQVHFLGYDMYLTDTIPSHTPVVFDERAYEDTHTVLHGKKVYQAKTYKGKT